jgi:hypothetical protein
MISSALLVWGLGGATIYIAYYLETPAEFAETAETVANREAYATYIANIPAWAIAIGIGAAAGRLLGAVGLLLRRVWALPCYLAALVLFMVAMYRAFVFADVAAVMSGLHVAVEFLFLGLSVFAVVFAHRARSAGILT